MRAAVQYYIDGREAGDGGIVGRAFPEDAHRTRPGADGGRGPRSA